MHELDYWNKAEESEGEIVYFGKIKIVGIEKYSWS
jgi:hypothetical protein